PGRALGRPGLRHRLAGGAGGDLRPGWRLSRLSARGPSVLTIDPSAKISPLADIEPSVRGTPITIGARTLVDAFVKIKPAGGSGAVTIGADCALNSGTVIYTGNGVTIGDAVL